MFNVFAGGGCAAAAKSQPSSDQTPSAYICRIISINIIKFVRHWMLSADWSSLNYYEPTLQWLLVCNNWRLLYLVVKGWTREWHDRKRWMDGQWLMNEFISTINKWKNGSDSEAKGSSRRRPSVGREFTCLVSHWELWRRVWWWRRVIRQSSFLSSVSSSPLAIAPVQPTNITIRWRLYDWRLEQLLQSSGYWLAARRTGNIV